MVIIQYFQQLHIRWRWRRHNQIQEAGNNWSSCSGGSGGGGRGSAPIQECGTGNTPPVSPPQGNPGGNGPGGGAGVGGGSGGAGRSLQGSSPTPGGAGGAGTHPGFAGCNGTTCGI